MIVNGTKDPDGNVFDIGLYSAARLMELGIAPPNPTPAGKRSRSSRSRLNDHVTIVERRSLDRAKTDLFEQDAVLGDAPLPSVYREH